jgi:hypothetical protein
MGGDDMIENLMGIEPQTFGSVEAIPRRPRIIEKNPVGCSRIDSGSNRRSHILVYGI